MKKLVLILSMVLLYGMIVPSVTYAQENQSVLNQEDKIVRANLTEQQKEFLKKYELILSKFELSEGDSGQLILSVTKEELVDVYGFTISESENILNAVRFSYLSKNNNLYQSRMYVDDGKIYFSYDDVVCFLSSAAQVGPAAIYGALVGLGTISLGPAGTAIVGTLGILGAPSLLGFTYQVIQATINREGVYIGVEMNGMFPNIVSGTW